MTALRIGLIGDRNDSVPAHVAIPRVFAEIGAPCKLEIQPVWLETSKLAGLDYEEFETELHHFDGLWCVPNCPYASMAAALRAIQFAREYHVPFLGTCGGFQHAIIEFARNVMGIADAEHAECHPAASNAIITPLSCSLVGHIGPIRLAQGTVAAKCYGRLDGTEQYHCNYGLSADFRDALEAGGMRISGFDQAGEPRIVELSDHRFFIGTLFQPERSSTAQEPHPLIVAFVAASAQRLGVNLLRAPNSAAKT